MTAHEWFFYHKWECCRKCGIVRRADDKNKPCPGVVRVELRADTNIEHAIPEGRAALSRARGEKP